LLQSVIYSDFSIKS